MSCTWCISWKEFQCLYSSEVETSHKLISIRLYFILTIWITENGPQPSILSDCNFSSSAGEVSGTQGIWEGGVEPVHRYRIRRAKKGHLNLWFWFFHYFFCIFNSNPQFWEKFQCVLGPQSSIVPPCVILLEVLVQSVDKSLLFVMAQLVRHLATSLLESSNDKSMSTWYASYIEAT